MEDVFELGGNGAYIKYARRPGGRGVTKCVQISAWEREGRSHKDQSLETMFPKKA